MATSGFQGAHRAAAHERVLLAALAFFFLCCSLNPDSEVLSDRMEGLPQAGADADDLAGQGGQRQGPIGQKECSDTSFRARRCRASSSSSSRTLGRLAPSRRRTSS